MLARSRAHLAQAGERYFEHMRFAGAVGAMMVAAGLACMIHALVPALCTRTASSLVARLTTLFGNRDSLPTVAAESSGALTFVGLALLSGGATAVLFLQAGPTWIAALLASLSLAFPVAYLLSNPELAPLEASGGAAL